MSDLIERLRAKYPGHPNALGNQAADRIEELEQQLAEQRQINANITEAARKESIRAGDLERDAARYRWLAGRVLACDYGDNDAPGEQIGWRICHDLLPKNGGRQPAFMYGASINAAIDAARSTAPETSPPSPDQ